MCSFVSTIHPKKQILLEHQVSDFSCISSGCHKWLAAVHLLSHRSTSPAKFNRAIDTLATIPVKESLHNLTIETREKGGFETRRMLVEVASGKTGMMPALPTNVKKIVVKPPIHGGKNGQHHQQIIVLPSNIIHHISNSSPGKILSYIIVKGDIGLKNLLHLL